MTSQGVGSLVRYDRPRSRGTKDASQLALVLLSVILCTGCTGPGWTFRFKDFTVAYGGATVSTTVEFVRTNSTNEVLVSGSGTNAPEVLPK